MHINNTQTAGIKDGDEQYLRVFFINNWTVAIITTALIKIIKSYEESNN